MSQLFIDGYSEYELEAMKIPINLKSKCLKQLVNYTKCSKKQGASRSIFLNSCEDEFAKFSRCHQPEVDYQTASYLANWKLNNPSAFRDNNVSPTFEAEIFNPTILNFHR